MKWPVKLIIWSNTVTAFTNVKMVGVREIAETGSKKPTIETTKQIKSFELNYPIIQFLIKKVTIHQIISSCSRWIKPITLKQNRPMDIRRYPPPDLISVA